MVCLTRLAADLGREIGEVELMRGGKLNKCRAGRKQFRRTRLGTVGRRVAEDHNPWLFHDRSETFHIRTRAQSTGGAYGASTAR